MNNSTCPLACNLLVFSWPWSLGILNPRWQQRLASIVVRRGLVKTFSKLLMLLHVLHIY